MDAVAEVEVVADLALTVDVEAVGVGEEPFVAAGRTVDQQDGGMCGDRPAVQRDIARRSSELILRGTFVAQQLLERGRDLAAVFPQFLPLVLVVGEYDDGVADEFGDCLGARTAEHGAEAGDLDVVESPGLAVLDDLRVDEPADHVVTTRLAPFLNQLVVVGARLHDRIHAVRRDADALVALESLVEPVPQLLLSAAGTPSIEVITSTGNSAAKSSTASNEEGSSWLT